MDGLSLKHIAMGKYFTINELTRSNTADRLGIDNTPNSYQRANMEKLIKNLLDPIRAMWGSRLIVNSGFRCAKLNEAVGGVKNSEHLSGCAADLTTGSKEENKKLFDMIRESSLEFRQLIDEKQYSWVHVSYNESDNKKQVLHL